MKKLSVSYTRQNLAMVMQCVNKDRKPVLVTSERGKPVVMISLEDYNELQAGSMTPEEKTQSAHRNETEFLLGSPANAARLTSAAARAGLLKKKSLTEVELA